MNSKHWYKVTAPDGYQALELAYSPHDACRRAAENRPGYAPASECRAEIYITQSERDACRNGKNKAKERLL